MQLETIAGILMDYICLYYCLHEWFALGKKIAIDLFFINHDFELTENILKFHCIYCNYKTNKDIKCVTFKLARFAFYSTFKNVKVHNI